MQFVWGGSLRDSMQKYWNYRGIGCGQKNRMFEIRNVRESSGCKIFPMVYVVAPCISLNAQSYPSSLKHQHQSGFLGRLVALIVCVFIVSFLRRMCRTTRSIAYDRGNQIKDCRVQTRSTQAKPQNDSRNLRK